MPADEHQARPWTAGGAMAGHSGRQAPPLFVGQGRFRRRVELEQRRKGLAGAGSFLFVAERARSSMITKIGAALKYCDFACVPVLCPGSSKSEISQRGNRRQLCGIQMGQLAQKQGSSDGVRSFGQMLEKDHSDANTKATGAANSVGMTPPTEPIKSKKPTTTAFRSCSVRSLTRPSSCTWFRITRRTSKSMKRLRRRRTLPAATPPKRCPRYANTWTLRNL